MGYVPIPPFSWIGPPNIYFVPIQILLWITLSLHFGIIEGRGLFLSSIPMVSDYFCKSRSVIFTCVATKVSPGLFWRVNGKTISAFAFAIFDPGYPRPVRFMSPWNNSLTGEITDAVLASISPGTINATMTLEVRNISIFRNGTILKCKDAFISSNTLEIVSRPLCKWVELFTEGIIIYTIWSQMFTNIVCMHFYFLIGNFASACL